MKIIEPYLPLALNHYQTDDTTLLLMYPGAVRGLELQLDEDGFLVFGNLYKRLRFYMLMPDPVEDVDETKEKIVHIWTKDKATLLLTCSNDFFLNFALADAVAKKLKITDEADKQFLFNAFTYGEITEWKPKPKLAPKPQLKVDQEWLDRVNRMIQEQGAPQFGNAPVRNG